jgi:hypothetical protein
MKPTSFSSSRCGSVSFGFAVVSFSGSSACAFVVMIGAGVGGADGKGDGEGVEGLGGNGTEPGLGGNPCALPFINMVSLGTPPFVVVLVGGGSAAGGVSLGFGVSTADIRREAASSICSFVAIRLSRFLRSLTYRSNVLCCGGISRS